MSSPQAKVRTDLDPGAGAMARGASVNLLGSTVATVLAFAFTFVITHVIAASDVGLFSLATTVVALGLVPALLGLDTGVVRFVALGAAVDDERRARGALQTAVTIAAVASTLVAVAIWWYAPWIAGTVFEKPNAEELIRIVSASLPAVATGRVLISAIRGFGVMTYAAWLGILNRVLDIATALPLLALGFGVVGLAWASVIAAYAGLALGVLLLLRVDSHALVPAVDAWPVGRLLRFSLPQTLTVIFYLGVARLDVLLLARYASAAEVGIYTIAIRMLLPLMLISQSIGQMFAPRAAAEDAHGDRVTLAAMLKRSTYWNTAISIPFFAVLVIVPVPILELFGPVYATGATALVILACGRLLNTASGPLGNLLNMSGRPYITMLNNAFVTLVNIGLGVALIPRYGMTGAAISAAAALAILNVLNVVEVRLIFGLYPFRADAVGMFGSGVIAALVALPVAYVPSWPSSFAQVVATAIVLFAAYAVTMRAVGLTSEDRELLAVGRRRLRRRLLPRRS